MPTFLFWNCNGQARSGIVASLARESDADVIALAEMHDAPMETLSALNAGAAQYQYAPGVGNTKIGIFARFSADLIRPIYETDRLTIRRLDLPPLPSLLLAFVHSPSKYAWNEASQAVEAMVLASDIRNIEKEVGHDRTVLVGDLNMNPFEDGVVSAAGLHAVMTRHLALKGSREVQGRAYPFFYNPMWGILGDHSPGPPGTYFHYRSEHRTFFWNAFDQVLIRPSLLSYFESDALRVLTHAEGAALVDNNGVPDPHAASDHLPIAFRLG